mgnify:CR=1 FL=1
MDFAGYLKPLSVHKLYEVRETAEGAALVTNEYKKLVRENEMPNIITTCCPSVNDLIEKYYPDCAKYMAPVVSPMVAHGRYIKKIYGSDAFCRNTHGGDGCGL